MRECRSGERKGGRIIYSDNMATAIDDRQELLEQFQAVSPRKRRPYFSPPGFSPLFRSRPPAAPAIARGFLSIAGFISHPRAANGDGDVAPCVAALGCPPKHRLRARLLVHRPLQKGQTIRKRDIRFDEPRDFRII